MLSRYLLFTMLWSAPFLESVTGLTQSVYKEPSVRILGGNNKDDLNVREHDNIQLTCVASGHPRPKLEWTITGGDLERRSFDQHKATLTIKDIKRSEGSRITCRAENEIGRPDYSTLRINIYYLDKPTLTIHPTISGSVPNDSIWFENTVTFRCQVYSNPPADVSWYKSGNRINPLSAEYHGYEIRKLPQLSQEVVRYILKIRHARRRDYGNYECRASLGRIGVKFAIEEKFSNFTFNSQIENPDIVLENSKLVVADAGQVVRLICKVTKGNPEPRVTWIRPNEELTRGLSFGFKKKIVSLLEVKRSDAGLYFCVANNNVGNAVSKKVEVVIRYLEPMKYWITPDPLQDNRRLAVNTDVKLTCYCDAQPKDELIYTWYKKNRNYVNVPVNLRNTTSNVYSTKLTEPIKKKFITFPAYSSRLEIRPMTEDDYGEYVCQAKLRNAPNGTQVTAVIPITRESAPAEIFPARGETLIRAREGDRVVLSCKTRGRPVPQINWYFGENFTIPIDCDRILCEDGKLIINKASRDDSGTYRCETARVNGFSVLTKFYYAADIELLVNYPPQLHSTYEEIRCSVNSPVKLTCFVEDDPTQGQLKFKWIRNGEPLWQYQTSQNSIISSLNKKGYGLYYCEVSNNVGKSVRVVNITGAAYAPEFYYANDDRMTTSSTITSFFPTVGSQTDNFTYLLSWTQKLPRAVDPIQQYRIRWKLISSSNNSASYIKGNAPWSEGTLPITETIEPGSLLTYELKGLTSGTYEVEVTPITVFGDGDTGRTEITTRKKRGQQTTIEDPTYFCRFDDIEICNFVQEKKYRDYSIDGPTMGDTFDWSWNNPSNQARRSQGTGPDFDHTRMKKDGGYMFIEASKTRKGDTARLVSPTFRNTESKNQCLRFFYHMKGIDIGRLRVIVRSTTREEIEICKIVNEQGTDWFSAALTLSQNMPYQIIFEAEMTKDGYLGDIAIDDVLLTDEPCPISPSTTSALPSQKAQNGRNAAASLISSSFITRRVKVESISSSRAFPRITKLTLYYFIHILQVYSMLFVFYHFLLKIAVGR